MSPLVYVAGPFSAPTREGVERNIERAVLVGIEIARLGACPVIPHANTAHPEFERCQPYEFWLSATRELMFRCDVVLMLDGWERSNGATLEHERALEVGMPVAPNLEALEEWLQLWRQLQGWKVKWQPRSVAKCTC